MIYDNFKQKLNKIKKVLSEIHRFRIPILSALAVIVAVTATLLGTNGIIYAEGTCMSVVTYGEKVSYQATAFMSSVSYEYYDPATELWTEDFPLYPGKYRVRTVAEGSFGSLRYGKEQDFEIVAKTVDVSVSEETLPYKDRPTVKAELIKGDRVECFSFRYTGLGTDEVYVQPILGEISVYNSRGVDVSACYDINAVKTPIVFTERPLQIAVADASKVYDGQPLTSETYTVDEETSLAEGDYIVPTFSASVTEAGKEVENVVEIQIFNQDGEDVTKHYDITKEIGVLKVEKRSLILNPFSATKTYDGTALEERNYTIDEQTPIVEGDTIQINKSAQQIRVGTTPNVFEISILQEDGTDVTDNYEVTYAKDSTLTVTKRSVTLRSLDFSRVYNGQPLSYEEVVDENLVEGETVEAMFTGTITDKGETENTFTAKIFNKKEDVTDCYEITYGYGKLKITERPIYITTHDCSWIYDGVAHAEQDGENKAAYTANDLTVDENYYDLVTGHSFSIKETLTSITYVWEENVKNELKLAVYDGKRDVSENYAIEYAYGKLSVTPRPILVSTHDCSWIYDGNAHSEALATEYTSTDLTVNEEYYTLVAGHWLTIVETHTSIVNVWEKEVENRLTLTVRCEGERADDIYQNYLISYNYGELTITPRPIQIKTRDHVWIYDGIVHYDASIYTEEDLIIDGAKYFDLVLDHTLKSEECTEVKNVWDTVKGNNEIVFSVQSATGDVSENYQIALILGTLTISPRPILVKTHDHEKMYDYDVLMDLCQYTSEDLQVDGETYFDLVKGDYLDQYYCKAIRYVWETQKENNDLSFHVKNEEEDVTGNYAITLDRGTLTITPRPITILTHTHEWVYDGLSHKDTEEDCSESYTEKDIISEYGLCYSDTIKVEKVLYSVTYVKDSGTENVVEFSIQNADGDMTRNYEITRKYGTLSISPRPVYIQTLNYTWEYDGNPHCEEKEYYTAEQLISYFDKVYLTLGDGDHIVVCNKPYIKAENISAQGVENDLTFKFRKIDGGADVTDNYSIIGEKHGILRIIPRKITVKPKSDEKIYDGDPLVAQAGEYEIVLGSLVEGHTLTVPTKGASIVDVGEVEHLFTVNVSVTTKVMSGTRNMTRFYAFTYESPGILKILPRPITILTHTHQWIYDGLEHRDRGQDCDKGGYTNDDVISQYKLVKNHRFVIDEVFSFITFITNVWESGMENVITFSIYADARNVTGNYEISYEYGTLHILARPLIVTSSSAEKYYDGTPLTCDEYEVEGLVDDHTLKNIKITGSQTEIGESPNTIEETFNVFDAGDFDVSQNYSLERIFGTLTVKEPPAPDEGEDDGDDEEGEGEGNRGGFDFSGSVTGSNKNEEQEGKGTPLFWVTSDKSGTLYVRQESYGDYKYEGWSDDVNYYSDGSGISPLNYAGLAAEWSGKTKYSVIIDTDLDAPYWLLYYTATSQSIVDNDILAKYDWSGEYKLEYYPYDGRDLSLAGTQYEALELAYRKYVYEYYLQIPEDTQSKLLTIAAKNGISASSTTLIDDIKNLVQNYREYSFDLEYNGDYAVDFFEDAKGGICQHFATAATAMYRAFGIPARYTIGFAAQAQAGYRVGVYAKQAHAWVEVYIDGMGWIPVEVTGGGPGGSGGGGGEAPELVEQVLSVKPEDMIVHISEYQTLTHSQVIKDVDGETLFRTLLALGYTYKAVVDGTLEGAGECEAIIRSFTLYDSYGNDVTEQYKLIFEPGVMKITDNPIIQIMLSHKTKVYDGKPIRYTAEDWWGYTLKGGSENVEVRFDISAVAEITEVGQVSDEELRKHISIWLDGVEITETCEIIFSEYRLEVQRRYLKLEAASDMKFYDGEALENDDVEILEGSLLPGHKLTTKVEGSITDIGEEDNCIVGYQIVDANGNDVTQNYLIECINGVLVIITFEE